MRFRLLLGAVLLLGSAPAAVAADFSGPPEDYSGYQPQKKCRKHAQPGTEELARWINRKFDGGKASATVRACPGGTSEHKDGRAIDWTMNAGKKAQRREVAAFLDKLFSADADDNAHAKARRMGIMYVIWKDHIYRSYGNPHFEKDAYLSSSCKSRKKCSKTLRHRDHVHISLSKPGAKAETTWYTRTTGAESGS